MRACSSRQWLGFTAPDPANVHYPVIISAALKLCENHGIPHDDLRIWVDYIAIPQSNSRCKSLAIETLPAYAALSKFFVIAAPETEFTDTPGRICDAGSYLKRGWVRCCDSYPQPAPLQRVIVTRSLC